MAGPDSLSELPAGPEDWGGVKVCVAGLGVSGRAAALQLAALGANVVAVDAGTTDRVHAAAEALRASGVEVEVGAQPTQLPSGTRLVVTSPGWRPSHPLLSDAAIREVAIWGEVELAWRLRRRETAWLGVTGTNGKTTTVQLLASMLAAGGLQTAAAGNVGTPLVDVATRVGLDVIAVELSSFQLHWTKTLALESAGILNIAPDHIDWHGDLDAYARAKGRIYSGVQVACVYNAAEPRTRTLVESADVADGARGIGITTASPHPGQLGLVEDLLVDRAFGTAHVDEATELASLDDFPAGMAPAPHLVSDVLMAAALARSHGVPAHAVREGLRGYRVDHHRIEHVARINDVAYVDDSKATNAHAALASLRSFEHVVWIAGGLAKGARFDDLVTAVAGRIRAVVVLGADRGLILEALARHAPEVTAVEVSDPDTGAMETAVRIAADLAVPGDTVLLAPACASMDMFVDYAQRGDLFASAARSLGGTA